MNYCKSRAWAQHATDQARGAVAQDLIVSTHTASLRAVVSTHRRGARAYRRPAGRD